MTDDNNGAPDSPADSGYSYEAFGCEFFEQAVTKARIETALSNLTGNAIDFGPRQVGPAGIGIASIKASGEVLAPEVVREPGALVRFAVTIPVYLDLSVRLAGHDHRFEGHIRARLSLTARARRPLRVYIDIPAPTEDDVEVEIEAQGLRASVLDVVADVDGELCRYVARYIAKQIDKPDIRKMRDIDIARRLEKDGPEANA